MVALWISFYELLMGAQLRPHQSYPQVDLPVCAETGSTLAVRQAPADAVYRDWAFREQIFLKRFL
jgi:hypothetical protein